MKKAGKWVMDRNNILVIQFHVNHKTYIRSTKLINTKENIRLAERMAMDYYDSIIKDVHYEHGEVILLSDLLDRFLKVNESRPDIKSKYSQKKRIIKSFTDKPFHEIRQRDVHRFIEQCELEHLSTYTINHHLTLLRQIQEYAKKFNFKYPSVKFPSIKNKRTTVRWFTDEEVERILFELVPENISPNTPVALRDRIIADRQNGYDIFITLLDTGARTSEILNLTWSDIDFANRQILLYRNKVKNSSPIPMTDRVFTMLLGRKNTQNTTYVFPGKHEDKPRDRSLLSIRHAIERAGVNTDNSLTRTGRVASVRTARSTFASRLVTNGVSLFTVANLLGHASTRQTEIAYARLTNNTEVVNAIKILNEKNKKAEVIDLADRDSARKVETENEHCERTEQQDFVNANF